MISLRDSFLKELKDALFWEECERYNARLKELRKQRQKNQHD